MPTLQGDNERGWHKSQKVHTKFPKGIDTWII